MKNMVAMPITKRMESVMGIQVCPISWLNFDYTENGGKKAFPANPKHQYCVSYYGEHDCNANNKKNGIVMGIQVCLVSWMNINYRENGGKKSISCKSKASRSCIPKWRTWL